MIANQFWRQPETQPAQPQLLMSPIHITAPASITAAGPVQFWGNCKRPLVTWCRSYALSGDMCFKAWRVQFCDASAHAKV
jgi:hypothetical protein